MKLAAGYIVFDGLETLEASIKSIRKSVDYVLVSYQRISWSGEKAPYNLIGSLELMKAKGLIDHIIEFTKFTPSHLTTHNDVIMAKRFECMKRQTLLKLAIDLGATHYLSIDADEFYIKSEFDSAKQIIEKESIDASAVHYINYVTPTLHQGYSRFKVPFIYRITRGSCHNLNQFMFGGIDPTRGILDESHFKPKVFEPSFITMHHMEMVRKDLLSKYKSTSRYFPGRGNLPLLVEDIENSKKSKVLDYRVLHFGDTEDGLKKTKHLIESPNLFNLEVNAQ